MATQKTATGKAAAKKSPSAKSQKQKFRGRAETNIYYILATTYGEPTSDCDSISDQEDMIQHNRRIWNGLMCRDMEDKTRNKLAEKINLPADELSPLNTYEKSIVFKKAEKIITFEENKTIDQIFSYIDRTNESMANIEVRKKLHMPKFVINRINFENSIFSEGANFEGACFGEADSVGSYFSHAIFRDDVTFENAIFYSEAYFRNTEFHSRANFNGAKFYLNSIFRQAKFEDKVTFINTKFERHVPQFYEAEMHKSTVFTISKKKKWPRPASDPEGGKNAYSCLRQLMRAQHNPDEEHFFYRQEMAWKAHHEGPWWHRWFVMKPYGWFSGYGYSVARPLATFAGVLAFPALLVRALEAFEPNNDGSWSLLSWASDSLKLSKFHSEELVVDVLKVSTANMLSLPGFERKYVFGTFKEEPFILVAIGGFQSVAAIVLVFLIGLALRNRFRLR